MPKKRMPVAERHRDLRQLPAPPRRCRGLPSPFGVPASASWASCPAEEFRPSCDRPTGPSGPDPTGFPRSAHTRRGRGGRPLNPGASGVHTADGVVYGRRLPPPPAARPYHPVFVPSSELAMTRHQRGFTHVRPSGLPLARLLPRTKRGPLGFFLKLRTPNGQDPWAHVEAGTDLEH